MKDVFPQNRRCPHRVRQTAKLARCTISGLIVSPLGCTQCEAYWSGGPPSTIAENGFLAANAPGAVPPVAPTISTPPAIASIKSTPAAPCVPCIAAAEYKQMYGEPSSDT